MIIDLHCDTASKLFEDLGANLLQNDFHIDIEKMKKAGSLAQFFALFIPRDELPKRYTPYTYCQALYNRFVQCLEEQDDVKLINSYHEYKVCKSEKKIAGILTIEGGDAIEGELDKLQYFYDLGVRLMTLTWNDPNEIGFPNIVSSYMYEGLTKFGKQVIELMDELGMFIDVSHLSDAGFWDVASLSKQPLFASHSNARQICSNRRNLTNSMIKKVSESGGIIGMNFYAPFLDGTTHSTVPQIIKHIQYMYNLGGIDVIALGSDFDGITCSLEIENIGEIDKLIMGLRKNGFTSSEIDKITYKNAERMLKFL